MVLSEHQETVFHCEGSQALAQVAQRGGESPSREIFKSHLDMVLGTQLYMALLERGAGQDNLQKALPTSAIL